MANSTLVTTGKPKTGGAIYRAPLAEGLALPTDAVTALDGAFVCLGYVGEDGLTNSNSRTSEDKKAWGGETVLTSQTEYTDKFAFKLLETLNADVLKTVFGSNNVTGTLDAGLTVKANSAELDEYAWVVEMIMRGNVAKRIVIPVGKISELGDVVYADDDITAYDVTMTAFPDTAGNTHYEYIKAHTV